MRLLDGEYHRLHGLSAYNHRPWLLPFPYFETLSHAFNSTGLGLGLVLGLGLDLGLGLVLGLGLERHACSNAQ
jgi:hypothetical protein